MDQCRLCPTTKITGHFLARFPQAGNVTDMQDARFPKHTSWSYRGDTIRSAVHCLSTRMHGALGFYKNTPCYVVDGLGDTTFATLEEAKAAIDGMHAQSELDALRYQALFPTR